MEVHLDDTEMTPRRVEPFPKSTMRRPDENRECVVSPDDRAWLWTPRRSSRPPQQATTTPPHHARPPRHGQGARAAGRATKHETHGVGVDGHEARVEADLHGQPGQLGVAHALGDDHDPDRQPGHDVRGQVGPPLVRRQPRQHGEEGLDADLRRPFSRAPAQLPRPPVRRRVRLVVGPEPSLVADGAGDVGTRGGTVGGDPPPDRGGPPQGDGRGRDRHGVLALGHGVGQDVPPADGVPGAAQRALGVRAAGRDGLPVLLGAARHGVVAVVSVACRCGRLCLGDDNNVFGCCGQDTVAEVAGE